MVEAQSNIVYYINLKKKTKTKKTGNIKIEKQATFKLCAGEVTFRIRYLFDLTVTSKVG